MGGGDIIYREDLRDYYEVGIKSMKSNKNPKKKVALVSAGVSRDGHPHFAFTPMTAVGLHYLKDILEKEDYCVDLVNQSNEGLSDDEVVEKIDGINPDYVLFNQFFSTRGKIRKINSKLKGDYIVGVGGHDATFHSVDTDNLGRDYEGFDFIWRGEVENDFANYLKSVDTKKDSPEVVGELESRVGKDVSSPIGALDSLPILKHNDYSGEIGFIVTSRGCLCNGCDFCTTPAFYKSGWKARSSAHVREELENLVSEGKKYVFISDDNFLGFSNKDLDRGNEIMNHCKDLGLKVMIMTTKEQILNAKKKKYLENWDGTCFRVFMGLENGDE